MAFNIMFFKMIEIFLCDVDLNFIPKYCEEPGKTNPGDRI